MQTWNIHFGDDLFDINVYVLLQLNLSQLPKYLNLNKKCESNGFVILCERDFRANGYYDNIKALSYKEKWYNYNPSEWKIPEVPFITISSHSIYTFINKQMRMVWIWK